MLAKPKSRAVAEAEICGASKLQKKIDRFHHAINCLFFLKECSKVAPAADGFSMAHSKSSYVIRHELVQSC